ncbi:putative B3 domain-containing protein At3g49610 [Magnolia sinica]|uniref:putative B3 domain-containing protein At3g49610 n=1 Tax=Magnolia sinica TaxID=86752 RepID=UPI0026592161|nr:putative B3 domain-containing protein At3g49610 [Magnolia sinica]
MDADFSNLLMFAEVAASASPLLSNSITTPPNNNNHNKKRKPNDSNNNNNNKKMKKPVDYNMPCKKLTVKNPSPRGWIEAYLRLKATSLIWAMDKMLTSSDTDPHQNRLLFPTSLIGHTLLPALTPYERYNLERGVGIECITLDHKGQDWITRFSYWKSSGGYTLNGKWSCFVKGNGLRAGFHTVQVRTFRHGPQNLNLGFIVLFEENQEGQEKPKED